MHKIILHDVEVPPVNPDEWIYSAIDFFIKYFIVWPALTFIVVCWLPILFISFVVHFVG